MPPKGRQFAAEDEPFMRRALGLAQKGYGATSPNPLVGAVIVRDGSIVGEGWHRRAGEPHAEVNAIADARRKDARLPGTTLYVTLEPCSTFGRTPPCTDAIIESGIARVVIAATDPNPKHRGRGFKTLRQKGIEVIHGVLRDEAESLNESFNHWILSKEPFVTLKCAMSLDGKIATNSGQSKWITGVAARNFGMKLRLGADAILAGVNTIIRDDPALTLRKVPGLTIPKWKKLLRVVLDPQGRIPLNAQVLSGPDRNSTLVVTSEELPAKRRTLLEAKARVLTAPRLEKEGSLDLPSILRTLGGEGITSVLVEGGGETHATLLAQRLANRVYFFYAPMVIGGRAAAKSVAGDKTFHDGRGLRLRHPEWRVLGPDLLLTGRI